MLEKIELILCWAGGKMICGEEKRKMRATLVEFIWLIKFWMMIVVIIVLLLFLVSVKACRG